MCPRQRHCHSWSWFRDLSGKCSSSTFLEESANVYGMLAGILLGLLALHPQSSHNTHPMDKGHTHIQCCRRQYDHVSPSGPLRDVNGMWRHPSVVGAEFFFFFFLRKKVPSHWICSCLLDSQPHAGFILPHCLTLLHFALPEASPVQASELQWSACVTAGRLHPKTPACFPSAFCVTLTFQFGYMPGRAWKLLLSMFWNVPYIGKIIWALFSARRQKR